MSPTGGSSVRILVVGINYAPENIGVGKYTGEMAEWLAARGHHVRVICAPPYYPAWATWPEHSIRWFKRECIAGVDVIRCPIWVPPKPTGVTRLLHVASFAVTSALAMLYSLTWRPQIVLNVAPSLTSAPAAWLLARLTRARSWLHVQDFELDAAMDMGMVSARKIRLLAQWLERWLFRRFDKVSTISQQMLSRLAAKGVRVQSRSAFPNWVDLELIQPLSTPSVYRGELSIPEAGVVALYSGNMNLKQGLELLSAAARSLADHPNLYFVFGGEGPARSALQHACSGLPNVRFADLQPSVRLNEWLGLADIHLLPQRADVADLVMPSKLTGMLASGRPVLATAMPGTGVAQALQGCGVITRPGDVASFVAAVCTLADDGALRARLGLASRAYAMDTLDCEAILERFEQGIFVLIERNPNVCQEPHKTR